MTDPLTLAMPIAFLVLLRLVVAKTFLRRTEVERRNHNPTKFEVASWYVACVALILGSVSWFLPDISVLRAARTSAPLLVMLHLVGTYLVDSLRTRGAGTSPKG